MIRCLFSLFNLQVNEQINDWNVDVYANSYFYTYTWRSRFLFQSIEHDLDFVDFVVLQKWEYLLDIYRYKFNPL